VLRALKPLINMHRSMLLQHAVTFLAVAVEEGKSMGTYAREMGFDRFTISRYLDSLGERKRNGGTGPRLVSVERTGIFPMRTQVFLTDKGRAVATEVFRQLRRLPASRDDAAAADGVGSPQPERQVLGTIAQFDKATLVARLKAASDRKRAETGKCGGRKSYAEAQPEMVKLARELFRPDPEGPPTSLRKVAAGLAERGFVTPSGKPHNASAVASMLRGPRRPRRADDGDHLAVKAGDDVAEVRTRS
jgi:DNA-binding MarR family transcriptional regulator